jgi:hypothetical protein
MEFVCCVWIWKQTANCALQTIKSLGFIGVVESVYSAVRTDCLYKADYVWYLERLNGTFI